MLSKISTSPVIYFGTYLPHHPADLGIKSFEHHLYTVFDYISDLDLRAWTEWAGKGGGGGLVGSGSVQQHC